MSEKIEAISRREAFWMLGTAIGVAIPAAVLTASNAQAQTPGMPRREDRRDIRQERREDRRDVRQDRRDNRQDRRTYGGRENQPNPKGSVGQGGTGQGSSDYGR
jgi:hypothetical protein